MKIITTIVGVLIGAGLLTAVPAHAEPTPSARPTPNCVTYGEAVRTFDSSDQGVPEIENGITASYQVADRAPGAVWRAYKPCRGQRRGAYVNVIYAKRANGEFNTIYWNYNLPFRGGRMAHDSWGSRDF